MSDAIWAIILFAVFAIFMDRLGKKSKKKTPSKRTPVPENRSGSMTTLPPPIPRPWEEKTQPPAESSKGHLSFKIPEIKGAPPVPGHIDTSGVYREDGAVLAEKRQQEQEEMAARRHHEAYEKAKRQEEAAIRMAEQEAYAKEAKIPQQNQKTASPVLPVLTPAAAQQAVVLAEILGAPRAHRPWRPRGRR